VAAVRRRRSLLARRRAEVLASFKGANEPRLDRGDTTGLPRGRGLPAARRILAAAVVGPTRWAKEAVTTWTTPAQSSGTR